MNIVANKTVNIRIQKPMVDWIDSLVESGLFSSRSEALREFTREMVDGKK